MHKAYFLCILLLKNFVSGYDSLETNNLTTATIRQGTSPKPTTFLRRINVKSEELSASSDFNREPETRSKKRKKQKISLWTWDSWCQLQAKEGKCEKQLKRFYYDSQLDECKSFYYSGCEGNKNNFETVFECERHCKGSSLMNVVEGPTQPNFCYLQPETGLCLAMIQKYYYDINERICKKFVYGGCGGNQNKFSTMFSCMRTCNDFKS